MERRRKIEVSKGETCGGCGRKCSSVVQPGEGRISVELWDEHAEGCSWVAYRRKAWEEAVGDATVGAA